MNAHHQSTEPYRRRLPERRPSVTLRLEHSGQTFFVTFSFDTATGRIGDVFGSTAKASSDFGALLSDACIALSIALQRGATPAELQRSMNRVPVFGSADKVEGPASVIGLIVEAMIEEDVLGSA